MSKKQACCKSRSLERRHERWRNSPKQDNAGLMRSYVEKSCGLRHYSGHGHLKSFDRNSISQNQTIVMISTLRRHHWFLWIRIPRKPSLSIWGYAHFKSYSLKWGNETQEPTFNWNCLKRLKFMLSRYCVKASFIIRTQFKKINELFLCIKLSMQVTSIFHSGTYR